MSNKLTEEMKDHIDNEISKIGYGKVTIEVQETANKVDIITEERRRFFVKKEE